MSGVEYASGKDRGDENFPVASWLIAREFRPHVHAYYRFARMADDVADTPDLSPDEKIYRLDRMGAVLDGALGYDNEAPAAADLRRSLAQTHVPAIHGHDLLAAFKQDAVKSRYEDWGELLAYCRLSASSVGRYLLDLHGESRDGWPASDALCSALQILNHMQDCAEDYRSLDRVYIPQNMLRAERIGVDCLKDSHATPELRRVLDRMVSDTAVLVDRARALPGALRSPGLRRESAVIVTIAERLTDLLSKGDPLATRVKLSPVGFLSAAASALWRDFTRRR